MAVSNVKKGSSAPKKPVSDKVTFIRSIAAKIMLLVFVCVGITVTVCTIIFVKNAKNEITEVTMRYIKAPVHTIGIGLAASMGALILASGNKRSVLPHTKVMIHQPLVSGDLGGKETDIKILAKDLTNTRQMISRILAEHCRKPREVVEQDIENDCYMCAQEALEYGICDNIINIS